MKKSTIAIITSLCISAVLMIVGVVLALNYGDSFKNDSSSLLFGVTIGCIILSCVLFGGTVGIAIALPHLKKLNPSVPAQQDERQTLLTGKGAEYGLAAMTLSAFLMYIWDSSALPQFVDPCALVIYNVLLGILVYGIYRIWNDADFAVNKNRKSTIILRCFLVIVVLFAGISDLIGGEVIVDGMLTKQSVVLAAGIMGLILLATTGIKALRDRKDEDV